MTDAQQASTAEDVNAHNAIRNATTDAMPYSSLILGAIADGIEAAMPGRDQILDAIYRAVRDATNVDATSVDAP
jgi:hypothetical protein